ncbi:hypothetical protein AGMMS49992_22040 [Clostridia bacterium]|nr:hypothetical protein AGMMS49992_22040 [Clostridia bacterium]
MDTELTTKLADTLPNLVEHVYTDIGKPLFQPAASQIGTSLSGVVRVALSPLNGLIWGFDQIIDYVSKAVPRYFEKHNKNADNVTTPDPQIAVPLIENMRYTASKEALREMYASLLGAAMDIDAKDEVFPSFVSAIKEFDNTACVVFKALSRPYPAVAISVIVRVKPVKLLRDSGSHVLHDMYIPYSFPEFFAPHMAPEIPPLMVSIALRNMQRLGLITVLEGGDSPLTEEKYDSLYQHPFLTDFKNDLDSRFFECECNPLTICLTDYGCAFA